MGVDKRQSGVVLSISAIRERITDYDIFKYYCAPFNSVGAKFSSELREDPIPSAIISPVRDSLRYKDFGYQTHAFDSIGYVQFKYKLSFIDAMRLINNDFALGLSLKGSGKYTNREKGLSKGKMTFKKVASVIKIRSKSFGWLDRLYWDEFLVQKSTTEWFHVKPIDFYWINDNRFKAEKICYAYCEHVPRRKIYSPLKADGNGKWYGNMRAGDIQGWSSLLPFGDRIYVTSSLKDVMVLYEIGEVGIALQSEGGIVPDELMFKLMQRFDEVIMLYDNDFDKKENPGQTTALKVAKQFGVKNICIPTELQCKDPAAVMAAHGPITLKRLLRNEAFKRTNYKPPV